MSAKLALPPDVDQRVEFAIAFMRHSFCEGLCLKRIAKSVNLSPSRLRHLFKKQTGTTPAEYLKSIRLDVAKELAEHTFLSAKQIKYEVGLDDQSHFARDFKKKYGMTLTEYRKQRKAASFNIATSATI